MTIAIPEQSVIDRYVNRASRLRDGVLALQERFSKLETELFPKAAAPIKEASETKEAADGFSINVDQLLEGLDLNPEAYTL